MSNWYWVLLAVALAFSAFFSSAETAFISLPRVKIKHRANEGSLWARRVVRLIEPPDRLLATILLGNNLVNTGAAVLGTLLLVSLLGKENQGEAALAATLGITTLLLVFGEVSPKTLATRHAERLAQLYVWPLEVFVRAFHPIAWALSWVASALSGLVPWGSRVLVSQEEIRAAVSVGAAEGAVDQAEAQMMHRVLEFGERQVREVMVSRTDIVGVERGARLADFLAIFAASSHSRFPVFDESMDNIVGILSIKDVLLAQAQGQLSAEAPVTDLARPVTFVPITKEIGDLFAEMQSASIPLAMVVDEFGGIAGLVTLERLVEEIVGRLGDELARAPQTYETVDEHTFLVDGGLRIEDANEELGLGLPPGQYETVAGFVLNCLGHIPKEGEQIRYDTLKLVVAEMRGFKIGKVLVTKG